jgi:hypothetical protein
LSPVSGSKIPTFRTLLPDAAVVVSEAVVSVVVVSEVGFSVVDVLAQPTNRQASMQRQRSNAMVFFMKRDPPYKTVRDG